MRHRGALLLLLLAAGCGTTVPTAQQQAQQGVPDGLSPTSIPAAAPGGPATQPPTSAEQPGVTPRGPSGGAPSLPTVQQPSAVTTPLAVGFLYTNNDAAAGAGVNNGNTFTPEVVFKGLVIAWNARGGLAGRRIEPVFVGLKSSSTSLSSDLEAACQTFTRDHKVGAVLASTGIYLESFGACLARAGTPLITGDYAMGDETSLAAEPAFLTPSTLTTDERLQVMLERLVAAGRITRADRLGVVVENCPYNARTYDHTVALTARRLGLTIANRADTRCFGQIGDLAGQAGDMQNAVLRFGSSRVTQVLFVSGSFEGNLMLYFAIAAQAQGFQPHYALTSAVAPTVQEANTPKAQLARAAGLGWLPSIDRSADSPRTPAQAQCLADLRKGAGVAPASGSDRFYAFGACDTVALYDAALRRTAGHTLQSQVVAAVHALGTSFTPSATPLADFRGTRRTGVAQGRLFAWSTRCGCFDYTGSPFPIS